MHLAFVFTSKERCQKHKFSTSKRYQLTQIMSTPIAIWLMSMCAKGKKKEAMHYYQTYMAKNPDDSDARKKLGTI